MYIYKLKRSEFEFIDRQLKIIKDSLSNSYRKKKQPQKTRKRSSHNSHNNIMHALQNLMKQIIRKNIQNGKNIITSMVAS